MTIVENSNQERSKNDSTSEVAKLTTAIETIATELAKLRKQREPHVYNSFISMLRRWGWFLGGAAALVGIFLNYMALQDGRKEFRESQELARVQFLESQALNLEQLKNSQAQFEEISQRNNAAEKTTLITRLYEYEYTDGRWLPKWSNRIRESALQSLYAYGVRDFSNTNLNGIDYTGFFLKGADFRNTRLRFAINLTQSLLNDACGNKNTTLPDGLRIKNCDTGKWHTAKKTEPNAGSDQRK